MSNRILLILLLFAAITGIGWGYWQHRTLQALSADLVRADSILFHQIRNLRQDYDTRAARARWYKRENLDNPFIPELTDSCRQLYFRKQPLSPEECEAFFRWAKAGYRQGNSAATPQIAADTAWFATSPIRHPGYPAEALRMNLLLWVEQALLHGSHDALIGCSFGSQIRFHILSPTRLSRNAPVPIQFMLTEHGRETILIDSVRVSDVPIGRVTRQSTGIYLFHYQLCDLPKTGDTAVFQLTADIPHITGGFSRMPIELKLPVE